MEWAGRGHPGGMPSPSEKRKTRCVEQFQSKLPARQRERRRQRNQCSRARWRRWRNRRRHQESFRRAAMREAVDGFQPPPGTARSPATKFPWQRKNVAASGDLLGTSCIANCLQRSKRLASSKPYLLNHSHQPGGQSAGPNPGKWLILYCKSFAI